ncbi:hypothetical protein J7T55_010126 [Diaporthe amygdali]|uniref:uncharacterized protein n=1 Tax=Phomopsis amygdali TaxID=1214568 RepID=UPI0022FE8F6C|nr:uncharacterized protein J7T55_010126 [Diaporthe amygdali]KAJ0113882.1 hypothetical protein J7T55_010126 [Diaporthe amygdali]
MESTYQLAVSLLAVLILVAGSYFAYEQGYMDPLIEKFGVFMMKAKAEAEAKEMQAKGLKRGEDFVDSELKGNKQAQDIKAGVGSLGGLKKSL